MHRNECDRPKSCKSSPLPLALLCLPPSPLGAFVRALSPSAGCGMGKHGFQTAIARFLNHMLLALRASGLWLRYATPQNLIPPPTPSTLAQSQERKGNLATLWEREGEIWGSRAVANVKAESRLRPTNPTKNDTHPRR